MYIKRLLLVVTLTVVHSPVVNAEISEVVFKDTLNAEKSVKPDKVWINPVTGFDVQVITGLDRYVELTLLNTASASVWSARSTKVTVDDRLKTSSGSEFYGKRISIPAVGEDDYILREVIYDLQNKVVSSTDYPLSIDRTAPTTGVIGYARGGWSLGSDAAFTSIPAGMQYAAVNAVTFNGLADTRSGLESAEYFTVDPSGVERKKNIGLNKIDGSVTVQIKEAANADITPVLQGQYRVGIYVFDKAGNRSELSRTSTIDRVMPWLQFQVLNDKNNTWVPYTPNMVVYSNPVKIRTVRRKADFAPDNGTEYGWADKMSQTSDSEFNIYTYNFVYPNNTDSYYDFQTYAGGIRRVVDSEFKFTPDPDMELGPKSVSSSYYRSDTEQWINKNLSDKEVHFSAFTATVAARPYAQKIRITTSPVYNCIIPPGEVSCTMKTDLHYVGKGSISIYVYAGKTDTSIFDTKIGGLNVTWDSNPPIIKSATVSRLDKTILMTAVDEDRINSTALFGRWDTNIFTALLRNDKGEETILEPKTWTESDFKTKNAVFSYANLPDGRYTIVSVSATDLVGNTATHELNAALIIDSVPPTINFSYRGATAEGKLIKGLENLVITLSDASGDANFTSLNLSGGPNKENVSLTTIKTGNQTYALEYPMIFPAINTEDGTYKLTVNAVDGSGNKSSRELNFLYEPENLIVLDNMTTLATATALKTSDDKPLAFIRTSQLRNREGSIITGQIRGVLTLRKDSSFPITIAGVTVAPGEAKDVVLDMGMGKEKLFPVTPAVNGVAGSASFSITLPQI